MRVRRSTSHEFEVHRMTSSESITGKSVVINAHSATAIATASKLSFVQNVCLSRGYGHTCQICGGIWQWLSTRGDGTRASQSATASRSSCRSSNRSPDALSPNKIGGGAFVIGQFTRPKGAERGKGTCSSCRRSASRTSNVRELCITGGKCSGRRIERQLLQAFALLRPVNWSPTM